MATIIAIVVTATVVAIVITINGSKNGGQGDDQSQGSHGIVDHRSNIAADSNGLEGLGSVPLLS